MIVFRNPGVIDIESITTFGVSSKEKVGAIGFFGTGLKYAIAVLLREGCTISIITGGKIHNFGVEDRRVRVNEFKFVTMNGERLAFTTDLGKTWELWCAFRELYCNCMDENGTAFESNDFTHPEGYHLDESETTILVNGEPFRDIWHRRAEYILDKKPIITHELLNISPGRSEFAFYRGIRAMKLSAPSGFTYDVQRRLDLTEDRTVRYPWEVTGTLARVWMTAENIPEQLIERAVTAPKGTLEHELEFSGHLPSENFMRVITRLYEKFDPRLNNSAKETCRIWMFDRVAKQEPSQLSSLDQLRLDKAVAFCKRIGFPVDQYPILTSDFLGQGVLGQAHEGKIYLCSRAFMMGTKMIAGTLIEEFIHLRHDCRDMTREMQNILMDTICGLGEQITGEPL